jgi:signal transduction histidine kinase
MSGFEVLKEIKAKEKTKDIIVIVNSALDDTDSIKEALELGAYDYFTKPFTKEEKEIILPLKIKNALKIQKQRRSLKEAQEQLIITEKMATIGTLVAGVAHEINTPLSAIKSNLYLEKILLKDLNSESEEIIKFKETLASMQEINQIAIERIMGIVVGLKGFARLDEAVFKEVNLHEGIDNTLLIINNQIKDRIEIIKQYGKIPLVACYPGQLNQVFLNVLVNAMQAIEGRGRITISTSCTDSKVYIAIEDSGQGISEANIAKIFDPGFTTKGVGVGTGLGLSISYKIVEKHKGKIMVESKLGVGTKMTIELPIDPRI